MTALITDDFNRPDEVLSAGSWTFLSGNQLFVASNEVSSGASSTTAQHDTDMGLANHYAQAQFGSGHPATGQSTWIMFSMIDDDNWLAIRHLTSQLQIFEKRAGSSSSIGNNPAFTSTGGEIYKAQRSGDTITIYIDDILYDTITVTGINGTRVGHRASENNQTGIWDNFEAGDLTAASSADITGTLTDPTLENNIVAGGKTLITTLTGDTYDATLGADNAVTTAYLDGLVSAQSEANGWNADVRAALTFADVTRDTDTQCTLLMPAVAGYDITATETIEQTVPALALAGTSAIVATPTFTVLIDPVATVTGTITASTLESDIVTGGKTIITGLTGTTFVATLGQDNAATTGYLQNIVSSVNETFGWNNVVANSLVFTDMVRDSDFQTTITLPAFPTYEITTIEPSILQTVTNSALTSGQDIIASPTFSVDINVTTSISITLTDRGGAPVANATGLNWAFFDESTTETLTTAVDKDGAGTTNASGVFTVQVPNTTLIAGQIGWLVLSDSDGTVNDPPTHNGFTGPAAVI